MKLLIIVLLLLVVVFFISLVVFIFRIIFITVRISYSGCPLTNSDSPPQVVAFDWLFF